MTLGCQRQHGLVTVLNSRDRVTESSNSQRLRALVLINKKIGGQSTNFLLDLQKWKSSRLSEQKSNNSATLSTFILLIFSPTFPQRTYGYLLGRLYTAEREIIRYLGDYWTPS